jgi:Helix-turn-helix domain
VKHEEEALPRAGLQEQIDELREQVLRLEMRVLRAPPSGLLSEREVATELGKRPSTIREWKRSGKLKTVDVGGRYPKFHRSDVERIKREGKAALTRRPRRGRATAPTPLEPLESMLARMDAQRKNSLKRGFRAPLPPWKPAST